MMKKALFLAILFLTAACQPEIPAVRPTVIAFPTMTPGQILRGFLTPVALRPVNPLSNPATVEALGNLATPPPDYTACPVQLAGVTLPEKPDNATAAAGALLDFLNTGGTAAALEAALRDVWQVTAETGYILQNDLTASGAIDLIIGYVSPENTGTLLIAGCSDGRYVLRYQTTADGDAPPQIISLGDINRSFINDLVFARRVCKGEACEFETQMIEWSRQRGRFVNLLNEPLISLNIPAVRDVDNDQVGELVLTLTSRGSSGTGPLRTGVNIFDWNGATYVLSIIQLDPPRYRIQVIHEADKAFFRLDMPAAANLYQQALDNVELRDWFNDEARILISYIYYRQLLVYGYTGDVRLSEVLAKLNSEYPTGETVSLFDLPPYVEMAYAFVTDLQNNQDLHRACLAVQAIIEERPSALQLLNRYGSRSPTYTALQLCPY